MLLLLLSIWSMFESFFSSIYQYWWYQVCGSISSGEFEVCTMELWASMFTMLCVGKLFFEKTILLVRRQTPVSQFHWISHFWLWNNQLCVCWSYILCEFILCLEIDSVWYHTWTVGSITLHPALTWMIGLNWIELDFGLPLLISAFCVANVYPFTSHSSLQSFGSLDYPLENPLDYFGLLWIITATQNPYICVKILLGHSISFMLILDLNLRQSQTMPPDYSFNWASIHTVQRYSPYCRWN